MDLNYFSGDVPPFSPRTIFSEETPAPSCHRVLLQEPKEVRKQFSRNPALYRTYAGHSLEYYISHRLADFPVPSLALTKAVVFGTPPPFPRVLGLVVTVLFSSS